MANLPAEPHPLDGCDPNECYRVMMAERATLIIGRRESEDSLVKNVIQLSSALVAVLAGFITQADISIAHYVYLLFCIIIGFLSFAIAAGLAEQFLSSKSYLAQQELLELYYTKEINSFIEPKINRLVRLCQALSFFLFIAALISLGIFAILQAKDKTDVKQREPTAAGTAAPSAAAAAAAAAAPSSASSIKAVQRGQSAGIIADSVGSAEHATLVSKEAVRPVK